MLIDYNRFHALFRAELSTKLAAPKSAMRAAAPLKEPVIVCILPARKGPRKDETIMWSVMTEKFIA
jgi:hypothetical protein